MILKINTTSCLLILVLTSFFGLPSCSKDNDKSAKAIACRQLVIGNYVATFSKCTSDQVFVLSCKESKNIYQCECKKGATILKKETVSDKPYELTIRDGPLLYKNATAAANKICGFGITFKK